jgi:phage replication-related protein YjqB (UPF0714/DUF867 family)
MPDRYAAYAELARAEVEGQDYQIQVIQRDSALVVVAPHGGNIEPGTSEIALAIAGSDLSCYLFEGLKYYGNKVLHITSSRFDEPRCLAMLASAQTVLTVHGESGDSQNTFVGGLDRQLRDRVAATLKLHGFRVAQHANPSLQGVHPRNICNLGQSACGVQLEIARGLRDTWFESMTVHGRTQQSAGLLDFAQAVRTALA